MPLTMKRSYVPSPKHTEDDPGSTHGAGEEVDWEKLIPPQGYVA